MKLKILIICAFAGIIGYVKAQEAPIEKIVKHLTQITNNYPQEKVHLHLDKPHYVFGEDIWIKGYVVIAEDNKPSLLSAVLHVDLINDKNETIKKVTLKIDTGLANGNISLNDSLAAGIYRIRAYTNYMRNYASSFFFEKSIQIGNITSQRKEPGSMEDKTLMVQFFPEGGDLIADIRSKIGVKVIHKSGFGVNVSGYITNQNKEKVAEFTTEHAGIGVFTLMPKKLEKYTATITLSNGETKTFSLPEAKQNGFALAINELDTTISLKITGSKELIDGRELNVIAQNNGVVYGSYKYKLTNAAIITNISKKDFPSGIVHFTLFDATGNPIAERLLFVNNQEYLAIEATHDKASSSPKEKVSLSLNVKDILGQRIKGNFSIAVVDAGNAALDEDNESSILSNLLLTSDLKGYIEQPNYYFNNVTDDKKRQLNNLLLTQGWRRFIWSEVRAEKEPDLNYRIEQSLEIAGTITNLADKPIPNAKILLYSNSKKLVLMLDTISDSKGRFVFDRLDLPDSVNLFIQAKNIKGNANVKLKLDNGPIVEAQTLTIKPIDLSAYATNAQAFFDDFQRNNLSDKTIRLKTVNIVSKKSTNPMANPVVGSQNISGRDYVIGRDKLKTEFNLFEVFYKVPGVRVAGGKVYKSSMRGVTITSSAPPMLIYLNGQLVDSDILTSLTADDVEAIEVLTSNSNLSVYGINAMWGILHITMRKGKDIGSSPSTNIKMVSDRSFSVKKEFYMPDYEDPKLNKQLQDLRSTIYWNPNLNTNKQGIAKVSFFNAGTSSTYKVVIEGMDVFGNLGRKTYTYVVK